jgi:general secretion pathway protein D
MRVSKGSAELKTSKLLCCLFAGSIAANGSAALAAPATALRLLVAADSVGQTHPRATAADRQEVDKLLSRARQAIKENNLGLADSLVSRAEALHVDYGMFHVGDTPKKARHDLDALKKMTRSEAKPPSQNFKAQASERDGTQQASTPTSPPADPSGEPGLGRTTSPMMKPPGDDTTGLPGLGRQNESLAQSAFARKVASGPPADGAAEADLTDSSLKMRVVASDMDARRRSDLLLLNARRAVAQNDLRRATALVAEAKALNVNYGIHDDSPVKVETLLRKAADVAAMRSNTVTGDSWRRPFADLLMEQAEQLLRYKEFDEAERLAMDASRLKANYGPFDAKPEALIGKINHDRKTAAPGAGVAQNSGLAGQSATQATALVPTPPVGPTSGTPSAPAMPANQAAPPAKLGADPKAMVAGASPMAPPQRAPGRPMVFEPIRVAEPLVGAPSKDQVLLTLAQARAALAAGDIEIAEQLARQADALQMPESAFGPADDRPWLVLIETQKFRARQSGVVNAGGGGEPPVGPYPATQAMYDQTRDVTRNVPSAALMTQPIERADAPERLPVADAEPIASSPGEPPAAIRLFLEGEQALRDRDVVKARERFRDAYTLRDQLDPQTAQRLQDHLQLLSGPQLGAGRPASPQKNLIDDATARQQLAFKQLSAEVSRQQVAARNLMPTDPQKALDILKQAQAAVEASSVVGEGRASLLKRLEVSRVEVDKYFTEHKAQLDFESQNKQVLSGVEERRLHKLEIDDRLAKMINDFNRLMEEKRFAEAEVIAKRAAEIAPDNAITRQLMWNVKFAYRNYKNQELINDKEQAVWTELDQVEQAARPFNSGNPYVMPDATSWKQLSDTRLSRLRNENRSRRSERDLDIERKLKTPVSLRFKDKPLSEVLDELAKLAAVNLHLDPEGLQAEAVESSRPVTIELNQEISLKSALHLILEPLHLSYVIKDEVLKITSEQLRDGEIYPVTYSVADLVIPIPNFAPNNGMGLQGALREGYAQSMGVAGGLGFGNNAAMTAVANPNGSASNAMINPALMAQMAQSGSLPGGSNGASQGLSNGMMPGGAGSADFDSLVDLITATISPTTWDEVGGPGSIAPYRNNLSLVISQTQDVHDQIADLLSQLRRLQDLQVTIEVRFITLNDNFFEQIGVDFNFNIVNQDRNSVITTVGESNASNSGLAGLQNVPGTSPTYNTNLAIPFLDNSYSLAAPQFGQATSVASFGFAILSDIEAYFLVNASQGDRRSNVMQAPKVTLFNGQQASVFDQTVTPFVVSVIPVVGDFAAAQQPVIVVLSEGTALTVQAVVSNDRRFVRLTVVPFFSQIGDVTTFTFQGSSSSTSQSSASGGKDVAGDSNNSSSGSTTGSNTGITVQLPTFSFVSVSTTVSVPDGGTVLLGGVKRLSEGRNEFGVPILSKLPYVNRLFKNVGIGRETQSLMMMVTPRIIIQEEEESLLGIQQPNANP